MREVAEIKVIVELSTEDAEYIKTLDNEGIAKVIQSQRQGFKELLESEASGGIKFERLEVRIEEGDDLSE